MVVDLVTFFPVCFLHANWYIWLLNLSKLKQPIKPHKLNGIVYTKYRVVALSRQHFSMCWLEQNQNSNSSSQKCSFILNDRSFFVQDFVCFALFRFVALNLCTSDIDILHFAFCSFSWTLLMSAHFAHWLYYLFFNVSGLIYFFCP